MLEGLQPSGSRPRAIVRANSTLSCSKPSWSCDIPSRVSLTGVQVSATFAFSAAEGNVGENLSSQLTLTSHAHGGSAPVVVSHIKIAFEGGLRNIDIEHGSAKSPETSTSQEQVYLHHVSLQKATTDASSAASSSIAVQSAPLVGAANLALAPGITKSLSFDHVPRDAGDVEVANITLYVGEDDFDLELIITEDEQMHQENLWSPSISGPSQKRLKSGRSNFVKILPKPPKLQIELDNLLPTYFTNEAISIDLLISNEEEDDTDVILDARLLGPPGSLPMITWASDEEIAISTGGSAADDPLKRIGSRLPSKHLGKMSRSEKSRQSIHIQATLEPAEYLLEIKADYHILSDLETPISETFSANVNVVRPFEASYNILPLLCPEPWPSYFDATNLDNDSDVDGSGEQKASGLTQRWSLTSRLSSLADVPLIIDNLEPQAIEVHEGAVCRISPTANNKSETYLIAPGDLQERKFILEIQKLDLEDCRSTFLDLQLEIRWHREGSSGPSTISHVAVPELIIPFGEPRVLASAQNGEVSPGVVHLDYIIENPSMYTLTFNLTMDTSEEFAFSGLKNVSVQLVPLSRHTVRYNLMPLVKGIWISPQFRVFDTHFHKVLKVKATEGMRNDKKGVSVWVDADG